MLRSWDCDTAKYGLLSTLSFSNNNTQTSKLCTECAKVQIRAESEKNDRAVVIMMAAEHRLRQEYEDIFPKFPNMKEPAANGCTFCTFIRSGLLSELRKQKGRLSVHKRKAVKIILTGSTTEMVYDESTLSMYRSKEPLTLQIEVCIKNNRWEEKILKYPITLQMSTEATMTTRKPLSRTNLEKVAQWLYECDSNHPCYNTGLTAYTPTRLLSLKDGMLQIITGHVKDYRYAALSYCWGRIPKDQQHFLTTESNIASRMSGFSIEELPRTIKDAIQTARLLDINYIWIDALCIIQDNWVDWEREASTMDKVYSHAYLTIAATNSDSSFDGFLHDREPSFRTSVAFDFREIQPFRSQIPANESGLMHFRYPPETGVDDHFSNCTWNQRGWTLQERLLSTRILYFTKDVFYYECIASQNIENPGYNIPRRLQLPLLLAASKGLSYSERMDRRQEYLTAWYQVVQDYSKRKLSHPRDKLQAIEGLAAALRDVVDDVYVYGLWKSDLHRGLLWSLDYSSPWQDPRAAHLAPAWSWASRDSAAFWDKVTFNGKWTSLIQVINLSSLQKCGGCNQMLSVQLELVAPVAPLRNVFVEYWNYETNWPDSDVCDLDEIWDELGYIGAFTFDYCDQRNSRKLFLADTEMMLIAEKAETGNTQAIIIERSGGSNSFKRIGHFVHGGTYSPKSEEDPYFDAGLYGLRSIFKDEVRVLV